MKVPQQTNSINPEATRDMGGFPDTHVLKEPEKAKEVKEDEKEGE